MRIAKRTHSIGLSALSGRATATEIHAVVEHLSHDNGDGTGSVAPGGALTLTR